jgi:L-fuculose-phosphate aldolase
MLVADTMRRLYDRGLTTCSGGNVSHRIDGDLYAITPAATDKGSITPSDVVVIDGQGNKVAGNQRPSSEYRMHTAIYERCPEVNAIVHAHPVHASLFTTNPEARIATELIAESWYFLHHPAFVQYERTATDALADACADAAAADHVCLLLQNHGVTTMGATMLQAFDRLELIENAARMTLLAPTLPVPAQPLTREQMDELDELLRNSQ